MQHIEARADLKQQWDLPDVARLLELQQKWTQPGLERAWNWALYFAQQSRTGQWQPTLKKQLSGGRLRDTISMDQLWELMRDLGYKGKTGRLAARRPRKWLHVDDARVLYDRMLQANNADHQSEAMQAGIVVASEVVSSAVVEKLEKDKQILQRQLEQIQQTLDTLQEADAACRLRIDELETENANLKAEMQLLPELPDKDLDWIVPDPPRPPPPPRVEEAIQQAKQNIERATSVVNNQTTKIINTERTARRGLLDEIEKGTILKKTEIAAKPDVAQTDGSLAAQLARAMQGRRAAIAPMDDEEEDDDDEFAMVLSALKQRIQACDYCGNRATHTCEAKHTLVCASLECQDLFAQFHNVECGVCFKGKVELTLTVRAKDNTYMGIYKKRGSPNAYKADGHTFGSAIRVKRTDKLILYAGDDLSMHPAFLSSTDKGGRAVGFKNQIADGILTFEGDTLEVRVSDLMDSLPAGQKQFFLVCANHPYMTLPFLVT